MHGDDRAEAIEWPAGTIDHTAQHLLADRQVLGAIRRAPPRLDTLARLERGLARIDGQHQRSRREAEYIVGRHRNSFSPWNPTTSASTAPLPGTTMRQPEPSGSLSPAASMTRPLMRVRRPDSSNGVLAPASLPASAR